MKTYIVAGIALTALASLADTSQNLTSVCDLGALTPTTTQWLNFQADTTNEAFTLSQDADFGTLDFRCNSGDALFDFAKDGDHTIKVKSFRAQSVNANWVILRGGTWNLGTGNAHDFRCSYNTTVDSHTIMIDSCIVTNADYFHGFEGGANNRFVIQNGSTFYAKVPVLNYPGAVETTHYTNNVTEVKGGSSFLWAYGDLTFDSKGSTEGLTYNVMDVTGRSVVKGTSSNGSSLTLGATSSGNTMHIGEGSLLYVPQQITIGNKANAKYNVLKVDGGSAVTNSKNIVIGNVEGAEHNRLELLNSELYGGEFNGIYVGYNGSFNELIVSDSAIKRCYFCCAGWNESASNNTVRIVGPDASIGGTRYDTQLFGRGPNNRYILDGCSIGSQSKACYFAFTNDNVRAGGANAIGNTFMLVNGATFSESSMITHPGCASNTIFVGANSSIRTAGDLNIRGNGNKVVVSNGTLYVSQSGNSMRFGKSATDDTEKGNTLVLQGTSPKVARIDPNNNYPSGFYNGSVLRFEIPAEGYSGVVFERTAVELHGTAQLQFSGIEECQRTIRQTRRFQLTSSPFKIYDSSGTDVSNTYLEQLNATMPDHSRVYRDASNYLWLEIAPIRGLSIIFR